MINRPILTAIAAASLVAAAIICVTELSRPHGNDVEGTLGRSLAWLRLPSRCGVWSGVEVKEALALVGVPEGEDGIGAMSVVCSGYEARDVMTAASSTPSGKAGKGGGGWGGVGEPSAVSPEECAAWCHASHPAVTGSNWCCQLEHTPSGDECSWTNGEAVLVGTRGGSSALEACPIIGLVAIADKQASTRQFSEHRCAAGQLQDVMLMDGDGPGLCSQICLPPQLWAAAEEHNMKRGSCTDLGCRRFKYAGREGNVAYNVYGCPPKVIESGVLGSSGDRPAVGDERTLDWLAVPWVTCGEWPEHEPTMLTHAEVRVQHVCEGGSNTDVSKLKGATRQACMAWCRAAHPVAMADAWCCQLDDTTGICSWTDGRPEMVPCPNDGVACTSTAFAACPTQGPLLAERVYEPYDCPDNRMHDAMKIDGDGPGLCSQICLNHIWFNVAQKHGVVHGTCADSGYVHFKYQSRNSGVPYNVYSK